MKSILFALTILTSAVAIAQQAAPKTDNKKILPVLWQQQSAEYRALCYQAFNLASWKLDQLKLNKNKQYAIITDIDETILDNSYHEAQLLKDGKEFTAQTWKQWTEAAAATVVPGAEAFLLKAKQKGISVFYISNRDTSDVKSTVKNLQLFNLPNADKDHLLFYAGKSSKEERRQAVISKFDVIMLLGDNLNDFTTFFEKKNCADRKTEVDNVKGLWGDKYIVIPNAIYGEWESALYDYERKLTTEQKEQKLLDKLTGFTPQ